MIEVIVFIVAFSFGVIGCFLATVGSDEKNNTNKIADSIEIEEVESTITKEQDISSPVREIAELFKARPQDFVVTAQSKGRRFFYVKDIKLRGDVVKIKTTEDNGSVRRTYGKTVISIEGITLTYDEGVFLAKVHDDHHAQFNDRMMAREKAKIKNDDVLNRARITKAIKGVKL